MVALGIPRDSFFKCGDTFGGIRFSYYPLAYITILYYVDFGGKGHYEE